MRQLKYPILLLMMVLLGSCEDCIEQTPFTLGNSMDSAYCGWTVTTFHGGKASMADPDVIVSNSDARVGAIFNTQSISSAQKGADWGVTIERIDPPRWTIGEIGQVYGVATDNNNNIFLAASNFYQVNNWEDTQIVGGNLSDCGMIYKCYPPSFDPIPFYDLPNNCGVGNGVGNIAYDYVNNQLFATNLEDGKIYRISEAGILQETYDPFIVDDGLPGIATITEQIYGIGVNYEDGQVKVYFSINGTNNRALYSIQLMDGTFPPSNSEVVEVSNLVGNGKMITDIAFSLEGNSFTYAESGNINSSQVFSYTRNATTWVSDASLFVGGNIDVDGGNTAGGVDYGPLNEGTDVSGVCDEFIYSTGKNLFGASIQGEMEGIQIFNSRGNSIYNNGSTNSNSETDLFIDYDQYYIDPCDIVNSFIINAGFEELSDVNDPPNDLSQLYKANGWLQATAATSDFYYLPNFGGIVNLDLPAPPNGSSGFVGTYSVQSTDYYEYVGACLSSPLLLGEEYSFSLLVGAANSLTYSSPEIDLDLILLGITNCTLPITGTECKESQFEELVRIPLNILPGAWEEQNAQFTSLGNFEAIMVGLSCSTSDSKYDQYYTIFDDIIITQGDGCNEDTKLVNYPGDVELFKCEGCFGPETLNQIIK